MKKCLTFVASVGFGAALHASCSAQDSASSQMSREEWRTQVAASRQRVELMRLQHKSFIPQEPSQDEIAEAATKRVLQDDTLKPGDIVSTTHGLFQFRGTADKQPTPRDFVRLR